jgi:hypothetical protein
MKVFAPNVWFDSLIWKCGSRPASRFIEKSRANPFPSTSAERITHAAKLVGLGRPGWYPINSASAYWQSPACLPARSARCSLKETGVLLLERNQV